MHQNLIFTKYILIMATEKVLNMNLGISVMRQFPSQCLKAYKEKIDVKKMLSEEKILGNEHFSEAFV